MCKQVIVKIKGVKELDSVIIEDNGEFMTAMYKNKVCMVTYNKKSGLYYIN
jgi:hypothetical protein